MKTRDLSRFLGVKAVAIGEQFNRDNLLDDFYGKEIIENGWVVEDERDSIFIILNSLTLESQLAFEESLKEELAKYDCTWLSTTRYGIDDTESVCFKYKLGRIPTCPYCGSKEEIAPHRTEGREFRNGNRHIMVTVCCKDCAKVGYYTRSYISATRKHAD